MKVLFHLDQTGRPVGVWSGPNDFSYLDVGMSERGESIMLSRGLRTSWDEWVEYLGGRMQGLDHWEVAQRSEENLVQALEARYAEYIGGDSPEGS